MQKGGGGGGALGFPNEENQVNKSALCLRTRSKLYAKKIK